MNDSDPLFFLPEPARDAAAAVARPLQMAPDRLLFHEGDPATAVYVVAAGQVKRVKHSEVGKDIILEVVGPGTLLGVMAVLANQPHDVSAQPLDDAIVWRVDADDFRRLVAQYPDLSDVIIATLSHRLREAQDEIRSLVVERVERRIARTLLKLTKTIGHREGRTFVLDLPLTRQDIAEMTGTTVETTIRIMSQWRRMGIVDTIDSHIVLLDPHRLIAISEEL